MREGRGEEMKLKEYREVHAHRLREIQKKRVVQGVELEGGTRSWVIVFCFLHCAVGVKVKRED